MRTLYQNSTPRDPCGLFRCPFMLLNNLLGGYFLLKRRIDTNDSLEGTQILSVENHNESNSQQRDCQ